MQKEKFNDQHVKDITTMASSPGLNFLIAKYLRGLPNSNIANVRISIISYIYLFVLIFYSKRTLLRHLNKIMYVYLIKFT